jgi:hypothetical protein
MKNVLATALLLLMPPGICANPFAAKVVQDNTAVHSKVSEGHLQASSIERTLVLESASMRYTVSCMYAHTPSDYPACADAPKDIRGFSVGAEIGRDGVVTITFGIGKSKKASHWALLNKEALP